MSPSAALLVALFSQTPSGATATETGAPSVRLDVRAAAACTSRPDLAARIAARSSRIRITDDAPLVANVVVASPRPGNILADLVLGTSGAEQPPRRIVARSCAEVADGVALIIAVTLDPTLRGRLPTATAPNRDASIAPPPPVVVTSPVTSNVSSNVSSKVSSVAPTTEASPARARPAFGASLAGQAIIGPAPAVMPGVTIYVMGALNRDGRWAPAVIVGATHAWRSDLLEPGGRASFALDAASLDACPLRLRWSGLTARPCASALVGRLSSNGTGTQQPAGANRPFVAAGAAAAMTVGLGSTVELTGRLGIGLTAVRDSYEFATAVFHTSSLLTISASLGIGVRWP